MTINIELDITRECNFQCPSCERFSNLYNKNPKSIMTLEEIHNIFLQIKKQNIIVNNLEILGGEPTLHPKFKEICMYLKYIKPAKKIILYTNHSNKSLVNWYKNFIGFSIADPNLYGLNILKLKKLKVLKHYNLYAIDNLYVPNNIVDICEGPTDCGILIYKYNNQIRYAICCYSAFISRLLLKENEYTFTNIYDCIKFLKNKTKTNFIKNICDYCLYAYLTKNNKNMLLCTKYKDFSIINDIFKNGYALILNNSKYYI